MTLGWHNCESQSQRQEFQKAISSVFKVRFLGEISNYLGLKVTKDSSGCYGLGQSNKINKLLKQYGMLEAREVLTPMTTGCVREPRNKQLENKAEYQSLVGSLLYLYLACWSRPDLGFVVQWLCS